LTVGSCLVFIVYIFVFWLYSRKRKFKNVYPEGDILLHEWLSQEAQEDSPKTEEKIKRSILDDNPEIDIPNIDSGFVGGFKINNDILKDDKK
jgi:hypothetical protein